MGDIRLGDREAAVARFQAGGVTLISMCRWCVLAAFCIVLTGCAGSSAFRRAQEDIKFARASYEIDRWRVGFAMFPLVVDNEWFLPGLGEGLPVTGFSFLLEARRRMLKQHGVGMRVVTLLEVSRTSDSNIGLYEVMAGWSFEPHWGRSYYRFSLFGGSGFSRSYDDDINDIARGEGPVLEATVALVNFLKTRYFTQGLFGWFGKIWADWYEIELGYRYADLPLKYVVDYDENGDGIIDYMSGDFYQDANGELVRNFSGVFFRVGLYWAF